MLVGIIAEFNPLHKGHQHLINSIKYDNKIVSIMSGDYVVRGEFAIYDKFKRANLAYNSGVDAVFELCSIFSMQNAENFSYNAIRHLSELNVDAIAFGAENPDAEFLYHATDIIVEIDENLKNKNLNLANNSYGNFVKETILKETGKKIGSNDMLAIEYIKQIKKQNLDIKIMPIQRIVSDFNTDEITDYSSTAIRKQLRSDNDNLSLNNILSAIKLIGINNFIDTENLNDSDKNRIYQAIFENDNYDDIIKDSMHKRLTISRIKRAILKTILGVNSEQEKKYRNTVLIKPLAINKSYNILSSVNKDVLFTVYKNVDRLDNLSRELYFLNESHSEYFHSLFDGKKLLDRTHPFFI